MKSKHSKPKRFFSAALAVILIVNTGCGAQVHSFNKEQKLNSPLHRLAFFNEETNLGHPVLVEHSRDSNGNENIVFEIPSDTGSENPRSSKTSSPAGSSNAGGSNTAGGASNDGNDAGHSTSDEDAKTALIMARRDRVDKDAGSQPEPKTREEILREVQRMEQILQNEKSLWEKINAVSKAKKDEFEREQQKLMGDVSSSIESASQVAAEQNKNAQDIRDHLITVHNSSTEKIYAALGLDLRANTLSDAARQIRPPTPYEQTVSDFKQANQTLRASAQVPALNDGADSLAELAKQSAQRGDLASFDMRMDTARAFAWASQNKGPRDAEALGAAINMSHAAKSLENQGLSSLADVAASLAKNLLHVALDVARLTNVVDVPLSVMEAFSGRTVDFDEDGKPFLRDCSSFERGFAIGTLVVGTGGVLMGAAPIALAAGAAGKVLKAFQESSVLSAGAEAGGRIFEETVIAAQKIERTAPTLMAQTSLSPYAKKHIWQGEIRISHDKTKIRIDGGLHTQEGLKNYLAQAPLENAPVSREMLSNGVERVVFPDSALTKGEINKISLAAEGGFGMRNGKSLFPAHWTPEQIDTAVHRTVHEGRVVYQDAKGMKKEIVHEGVTVIVNFGKDGKPNSAFPNWIQGE